MARLTRLALAGRLHLLLLRGLEGLTVFVDDADRIAYREALQLGASAAGVAVHGWGLIGAEVRLLVTPDTDAGPSELMQSVGRRFAHHVRGRHGRGGTLWDGRFRSTIVEPGLHFPRCLAWAEGAEAGAASAERHHGSLGHHLGRWRDALVTEHASFWSFGNTPFEREAAYRRLAEAPGPAAFDDIARAVRYGWVLGSDRFVQEIGQLAGRRGRPLPKGRPARTNPGTDAR